MQLVNQDDMVMEIVIHRDLAAPLSVAIRAAAQQLPVETAPATPAPLRCIALDLGQPDVGSCSLRADVEHLGPMTLNLSRALWQRLHGLSKEALALP